MGAVISRRRIARLCLTIIAGEKMTSWLYVVEAERSGNRGGSGRFRSRRKRERRRTRRGDEEAKERATIGKVHFCIERLYAAEQRLLLLEVAGTSD